MRYRIIKIKNGEWRLEWEDGTYSTHSLRGGAEKMAMLIETQPQHPEKEPCDGECNHDFCEGKQPEKEPLEKAIAEVRSVRKERESKEPCEWEETWKSFEEDVREYGDFPSALAEHCKAFFLKCLTSTREESTALARREERERCVKEVLEFLVKNATATSSDGETIFVKFTKNLLLADLSAPITPCETNKQ